MEVLIIYEPIQYRNEPNLKPLISAKDRLDNVTNSHSVLTTIYSQNLSLKKTSAPLCE